ncbi:hypothetical protein D3C75_1337150 [compost metagenome]
MFPLSWANTPISLSFTLSDAPRFMELSLASVEVSVVATAVLAAVTPAAAA